jgi:hypothetical protein
MANKFYYSEVMGMTQVPDDNPVGASSEREALVNFYLNLRTSLQVKIDKHQRYIDNIRDDMRALDDKYGYIKDEYPEEFL